MTSQTERAMISTRDLCFTPAIELLKLYRARKASPLEVMQEILSRVDAVNPDVNALVTLVRDSALREARRATAALRRGAALAPLFGVPPRSINRSYSRRVHRRVRTGIALTAPRGDWGALRGPP